MITDLFGNSTGDTQPEKSFEEQYTEYINSPTWKRIRDEKIKSVNGRCERCGLSKWSVTLTVHHRDYKHFKRERLEDLEVLCKKCHEGADVERVDNTTTRRTNSAVIRGFEKWMDKGNSKGWRKTSDAHLTPLWRSFLKDLARKTGKRYDIPYWRSPEW
jgi:hypothetical protein